MARKAENDNARRAALYARVSTAEQSQKGFSIDHQLESLRQAAEREGLFVADEYVDDGHTGATLDRPALQRMLGDAERGGFGVVLAYKTDRLSRNIRDLVNLVLDDFERLALVFKSASEPYDTSTPIGRKFFTDLGSFADFEREMILERTADGMKRRREQGFYHGSIPPSGYAWAEERDGRGKRRLVLREESETFHRTRKGGKRVAHVVLDHRAVRSIFDAYLYEGLSIYEIAKRNGMVEQTVYQMLRKANFYAGHVTRAVKVPYEIRMPLVAGTHPEIISEEEAEEVLKRLRETRRGFERQRSRHPLSGFLRCALCGATLYKMVGGEKRRPYYVCNSRCRRVKGQARRSPGRGRTDGARCPLPYYRMAEAEEAVLADLMFLVEHPDTAYEMIKREGREAGELERELEKLGKEVRSLETQREKLLDLYLGGKFDHATLDRRAERLEADIQVRQSQAKATERRLASARLAAVPSRREVAAMCRALWGLCCRAQLDVPFRRRLYKAILREVIVGLNEDGRPDVYEVLFRLEQRSLEPLLAETAEWEGPVPMDLPPYLRKDGKKAAPKPLDLQGDTKYLNSNKKVGSDKEVPGAASPGGLQGGNHGASLGGRALWPHAKPLISSAT